MSNKIFLGGTCSDKHDYRNTLIPLLKNIDYFNPVVDDWTEEAYQNELKEKKICNIQLYVITPLMKGVYSIAEAVDASNKNPNGIIFTYLKTIYTDNYISFSKGEIMSLNKVCEMINNNGGYAFPANSIEEINDIINKKLNNH